MIEIPREFYDQHLVCEARFPDGTDRIMAFENIDDAFDYVVQSGGVMQWAYDVSSAPMIPPEYLQEMQREHQEAMDQVNKLG